MISPTRVRLLIVTLAFLGLPAAGSSQEHTVPNPELLEPHLWTYGCTPTASAMVLSYWDNWVAGTGKYVGMGKLIKYYYNTPCSWENNPNTVLELKAAFETDYDVDTCTGDGETNPWNIDDGIRNVTNSRNGYQFVSENICEATWPQITGDWCWGDIKGEIDAGRPFVWSVGHLGWDILGHSLAAWGYTDDKYVIVYDTWSRVKQAWYYTDYGTDADAESIESSQVNRVAPGGWSDSDIMLDDPIGGETAVIGGRYRIHWYQWGPQIASVTIEGSTTGGNSWSTIDTVPSPGAGWKSYDWQVTSGATDAYARIRLSAYDAAGNLVAGDGSFGNFSVSVACSDLVVQAITTNPVSPMVNQNVNVTVTIRNQGSCDASPQEYFNVEFYKHWTSAPPQGEWGDINDAYTRLRAGGTVTLSGTVSYSYEGVFNMWARVDSGQDVAEANESNNVRGPQTITVVTDDTPTGSIAVNGGATWSNSRSVVLNLSCTDLGSGCHTMSFFQDPSAPWPFWTAPEPFATTKAWTYTVDYPVYVRFYDRSSNVSQYHDEIYVDETLPTGSVVINAGAASTSNPSVTLGLSCVDYQSRCGSMRLSNNNVTWTAWEAVAATRAWTVSSGDGTKAVYVQYRDNAGNVSGSVVDTVVLQTVVPGDLDGDGDIDQNDVNVVVSFRNQPASACPRCDLDGDGRVTALDARKVVLLCTWPGCAIR